MGNLDTTNLLLGIMAAVSVLEGLLIIGIGVAAWRAYRSMTDLMAGLEERQIAPAMARVNGILDEVKLVATHVRNDTERVEQAIRHTIDRVDGTAHRVRADVRSKASWLVGTIRGLRGAIQDILHTQASRPTNDDEDIAPVRTH